MDCLSILPLCVFGFLLSFIPQDDWWRIKRLDKKCYERVRNIAMALKFKHVHDALKHGAVETILYNNMDLEDDKSFNLKYACWGQSMQLIRMLESYKIRMYDNGLQGACISGNMDLVIRMINHGATDFKCAISYAGRGNNAEILKLVLNRAEVKSSDLSDIYKLCTVEMVQLTIDHMIEKGISIQWDRALQFACLGGRKDVIELVINSGSITDAYDALSFACYKPNTEIIQLVIDRLHIDEKNWTYALEKCCQYNMIANMQYLIQQHTFTPLQLNKILIYSCRYGESTDIIQLIIDRSISPARPGRPCLTAEDWHDALMISCKHGKVPFIELLLKSNKEGYSVTQLNEGLYHECEAGKEHTDVLREFGATRCRRCEKYKRTY